MAGSPGEPSLTVVVPATDRPPALRRCVAAIEATVEPPEETIVVDSPPFLGPAAARNAGARMAHGEVVVFVDSDVLVHRDALARIRRAFRTDPGLTAVFGAYDRSPEAPGAVSGFRNLLHHHVHTRAAGPCISFWAGLGAVRRDDLLLVGGFDAERYESSAIEDVELGYRMTNRSMRIELDPAIRGTHLKRWTIRSMVATDFGRRGLPWTRLVLERRMGSRALNLGMRHRLSGLAAVTALAALLGRRPRALVLAGAAMTWLNRDFYATLYRARGPGQAVAGVALHGLHHLIGGAAAAAGIAMYARARLRRPRAAPRPARLRHHVAVE